MTFVIRLEGGGIEQREEGRGHSFQEEGKSRVRESLAAELREIPSIGPVESVGQEFVPYATSDSEFVLERCSATVWSRIGGCRRSLEAGSWMV